MLHLPVLRWGVPYQSLEIDEVRHFLTGEPIAKVSQANGGLVQRDLRKAQRARDLLREIPCPELIQRVGRAADLYETASLPLGDGSQTPDEFVKQQSASTGLPEAMCRANLAKNTLVLRKMGPILDCLTRGLPLEILTRGWGREGRGVVVSYQAQSPVLGAVLPSNSPGVHALWLPAVPLQLGLVLKPGSQEPWTPMPDAGRLHRRRRSRGGPGLLSRRARRRGRHPVGLPAGHDVRQRPDGRAVQGQSPRPGARPGVLEDPAGGRRGRPVGTVPGPDGREHLREWRPQLHQLLGNLGFPAYSGDRRGAGRAAGADRASAAGRPRGGAGGLHRARCGPGHLGSAPGGPAGGRRRRHDRPVRAAAGRAGTLRATCGRRSCIANPPTRRSPGGSSCSRSPAWSSAPRTSC